MPEASEPVLRPMAREMVGIGAMRGGGDFFEGCSVFGFEQEADEGERHKT